MESWKNGNLGKIEIWKNGNLEKRKFEQTIISKMENESMEKWKF